MTNTCMPIHDDNHTLDNHTFENQTYEPGYTVTMMMMNASAEEIPGPALPISFRICNQPNTGLWSTILCAFTFFIAAFLRKLRHSKLFGKQVGVNSCILLRSDDGDFIINPNFYHTLVDTRY